MKSKDCFNYLDA